MPYYSRIILNSFYNRLFPKLFRHNRRMPMCGLIIPYFYVFILKYTNQLHSSTHMHACMHTQSKNSNAADNNLHGYSYDTGKTALMHGL